MSTNMEEHSQTEKSSSILDWLETIATSTSPELNLENVGGSAAPPLSRSELFPAFSSPFSHTHRPILLHAASSMTNDFPDHELTFSQAIEGCTNNVEPHIPSHQLPLRPEKLRFLKLDEWDEHNAYDEELPTCLHYSIEWKVSVNKKVISKDIEQDVVLEPLAYWYKCLRPNLEELLRRKGAQNRYIRCDDTTIIASVNDRSESDLTKRFNDTNIDWSVIGKQLIGWGELFRSGKKLRLDISFKYMDS
jgi:hypothetical protein